MPVYEEYTRAPRGQPDRVSDVMPWRSMIAPGVLLQKYRHGGRVVLCGARAGLPRANQPWKCRAP